MEGRAQLFISRTRLAVQRAEDLKPVEYEEETISVMPSDTSSGGSLHLAQGLSIAFR